MRVLSLSEWRGFTATSGCESPSHQLFASSQINKVSGKIVSRKSVATLSRGRPEKEAKFHLISIISYFINNQYKASRIWYEFFGLEFGCVEVRELTLEN